MSAYSGEYPPRPCMVKKKVTSALPRGYEEPRNLSARGGLSRSQAKAIQIKVIARPIERRSPHCRGETIRPRGGPERVRYAADAKEKKDPSPLKEKKKEKHGRGVKGHEKSGGLVSSTSKVLITRCRGGGGGGGGVRERGGAVVNSIPNLLELNAKPWHDEKKS